MTSWLLYYALIKTVPQAPRLSSSKGEAEVGPGKAPWDHGIFSKEGQVVVWVRKRAEKVSGSENAPGRAHRGAAHGG